MSARGGFSLPEALIALTISSVLVLLVGAVFLVQNDFYSHVLLRSQVQENARAISEVIATEVRSIGAGAVIVADSARLVVRSPMSTALVCAQMGTDVAVHVLGGTSNIVTGDVTGFGYLDASGTWSYHDIVWGSLLATGGSPTEECYLNGADTVGIRSEFLRLAQVDDLTGVSAANLVGSPLVIFRETEFRFDDSALIPGDRALYRGNYGGTLTELATGLSEEAGFQYWTGSAWSKGVSGGALGSITRIRLVAQSQGRGETSQQLTYDFGWTVDIPLPNTL